MKYYLVHDGDVFEVDVCVTSEEYEEMARELGCHKDPEEWNLVYASDPEEALNLVDDNALGHIDYTNVYCHTCKRLHGVLKYQE